MGEPAVMSPKERADSRKLADEIVEAVLEDECGPCDLPFAFRGRIPEEVNAWIIENEERIFQLAHELQHLVEDLGMSEAERQGADGEVTALRIALKEALDRWDWNARALVDDPHHSEKARIDQLRDLENPLRDFEASQHQVWIVVWKDRHTDDAISVHLSRAAADAKLDEHIAANSDEETLFLSVSLPPGSGSWVRAVRCHDDGPRGHIEEGALR